MEKKQLNFSAPLMSARRYSSPLRNSGEQERRISPPKNFDSIPSQISDINLGEVVKPGSIPFTWEQIPGKAKNDNGSQTQIPSTTHNLPPSMPFPPGRKSGELNGFRTPNKLSGELNIPRPLKFSGELNNLRPNKLSGEINKFYVTNDIIRWDSSKEGTEMNESSDSEDESTTFSDAIETFSQYESFYANCSVSGLSQNENPETKIPTKLPTEQKTLDFMMNRFLPAAKAMTLEPSKYSSRKQLVVIEKAKESKALVLRDMNPRPNSNMYKIVPYIGQDIGSEESEEEQEEEDRYDEKRVLSVKVKACGFLPWFCSKKSLRLVNPLPFMKDRSRNAVFSASKIGKLVITKSWRSPSQKLVKDTIRNPKQVRQVYKSCELQKIPKYTQRPMFYSGELQTRSGSPYRTSRRSNVSPFQNESPKSIYPPKGSKIFEKPGKKTRSSNSRTSIVESTQKNDSLHITRVSNSILNLPKTKTREVLSVEEAVRLEYGGRLELMKARGMSGPLFHSKVHSSKPSRILEQRNTGMSGPLFLDRVHSSESSRSSEKGNTNTCRDLVLVSSNDEGNMQSTLIPPLPKMPSESWLSRQFPPASPRVSPRNSVSYSIMKSKVLSRNQSGIMPNGGPKWENIVKSSHLRKDLGRYSEELVTPRSQQAARIWTQSSFV